jgi:predicted Zn-dependent protease
MSWEFGMASARAQGLPLVRDSEIEHTIRDWAEPLFRAARVDPASVRLLLVNDPSLNAFVAGGQNLFVHTGLLIAADSPGQVIGVLAHEIGHIAGGHLARSSDALKNAQNTGLFATLLGLGLIALGAASGASGAAQAGTAVITSSQSVGLRTFLAYTRTQERSADQAAVTYLDRTHQSTAGMIAFMEKLADQELLAVSRQDPYVRSHPLTYDRIEFLREHYRTSRWSDAVDTPENMIRFERLQGKLIGFVGRPQSVLHGKYPRSDQSLGARYARTVAYFRLSQLKNAIDEIDGLIAEYPRDPYFLELKGQILYESGRLAESIPFYEQSVALRPNDPLLLTGLGQSQLATGDPAMVESAVKSLEAARRADVENPTTWRLLANGYHDLGDGGASALASAEYSLLTGRVEDVYFHLARADRVYAEGSAGWLQAQDIRLQADQLAALRAEHGG